jgi:hypothetical protein
MMSCCVVLGAGSCDPMGRAEPAFKDVARKPPLTRQATVEYLVTNDRPMAVWIEEMAQACDVYACN